MTEIKDVKLTLYTAKITSEERNNHMKRVFDELKNKFMGKVTFKNSSVVAGPRIKLEFKEVTKESGIIGQRENIEYNEIDFWPKDPPDNIISTIQAQTGVKPRNEEPGELTESGKSVDMDEEVFLFDSDDEEEGDSTSIEDLRDEAGLDDAPDFDI